MLVGDWRSLPRGAWFYHDAGEGVVHRHTVAERTDSGWHAVCAMTYNNDAARADALAIVDAHERDRVEAAAQ